MVHNLHGWQLKPCKTKLSQLYDILALVLSQKQSLWIEAGSKRRRSMMNCFPFVMLSTGRQEILVSSFCLSNPPQCSLSQDTDTAVRLRLSSALAVPLSGQQDNTIIPAHSALHSRGSAYNLTHTNRNVEANQMDSVTRATRRFRIYTDRKKYIIIKLELNSNILIIREVVPC